MDSRVLISCKNLGYSSESYAQESYIEKWDIRELTLELRAGDRVRFCFFNNDQKEVLSRLFLKKLKPKRGSLINFSNKIYTEKSFWDGTDMEASLKENLKSKLFFVRPWFGGERKNLETLIDRLDLGGQTQYIPINKLSNDQKIRLRLLMIASANTKVILIDNLFSKLDGKSFFFVKEWLENFPGIVLLFGDYYMGLKSSKDIEFFQLEEFESLFSTIVSFNSDGFSKTLILENKP